MSAGDIRRALSWVAIACGVALCLWSLFLFAKQAGSQPDPSEIGQGRVIEAALRPGGVDEPEAERPRRSP